MNSAKLVSVTGKQQKENKMDQLANALAEIITAPDFQGPGVVIDCHNLVDTYLREWWPLYYRQCSNMTDTIARDRNNAGLVLEHWLLANRNRIETMRFITAHVDFERLRQASDAEASVWLHRQIGRKPQYSYDELASFALEWVPKVMQEIYSQLRIVDRAMASIMQSNLTH